MLWKCIQSIAEKSAYLVKRKFKKVLFFPAVKETQKFINLRESDLLITHRKNKSLRN